jgi:RecA-family ATPase
MSLIDLERVRREQETKERQTAAAMLAPELPFDEVWTPEPEANLVVPAMGLAPGPVHLVTGSWYTGKTLFLATVGLCVASGHDVFGLYRVKRGRWMHFDHEMGRRHLKRYIQRLRSGLGLDSDQLRDYMSLRPLPKLNLCTDGALDFYCELLRGCSLATFDPLRAAAPGQDENKSEFRQWLDMLTIVSDRTGCAILVLHHGGKPSEGAIRRNTGRGTSAIDDAAQTKFVLTAEEKGAPILVSHEKTRELTAPLDDFYLEIVSSADGVRLAHRGAEEMADVTERQKASKDSARVSRAKEAVRLAMHKYAGQFNGSRNELVMLVGGDRTFVQRAITELMAAGQLRSEGRGGQRVWSLV